MLFMIEERSKKIPLTDKEDRWVVRNLINYGNTLLSKEIVDFYQERFGSEWQDEVTRIFCNMTYHEAEPERFEYWESDINGKSTWFVAYNGRLTDVRERY